MKQTYLSKMKHMITNLGITKREKRKVKIYKINLVLGE